MTDLLSSIRIPLHRDLFDRPLAAARTVYRDEHCTAEAFVYSTGVAGLRLRQPRGHVDVLPFQGQIVWDVVFDGESLTMMNPFTEPKRASLIQDTYGCFAFHSGLLAAGVPATDDDHPLHGEFACAEIDEAWLEVSDDSLTVRGRHEYVRGFDHHYSATAHLALSRHDTRMAIGLDVENLSGHLAMPLQYMCHINSAYAADGRFVDPSDEVSRAWTLRRSVPGHVHPTKAWLDYTAALADDERGITVLDDPGMYDPEIVFLLDDLPRFGPELEFALHRPDGSELFTSLSTDQFAVATRWILHNADQQVAAYVLPGTSRPEGREAARRAGTLIELLPGEGRSFEVVTGIRGVEVDGSEGDEH